jgi:hypothetical protein
MTLIWTILQLDMAIICGSLLPMKPLFQLWIEAYGAASVGSAGPDPSLPRLSLLDSHIMAQDSDKQVFGVQSCLSKVKRRAQLSGMFEIAK